jgi:hypothetical protein
MRCGFTPWKRLLERVFETKTNPPKVLTVFITTCRKIVDHMAYQASDPCSYFVPLNQARIVTGASWNSFMAIVPLILPVRKDVIPAGTLTPKSNFDVRPVLVCAVSEEAVLYLRTIYDVVVVKRGQEAEVPNAKEVLFPNGRAAVNGVKAKAKPKPKPKAKAEASAASEAAGQVGCPTGTAGVQSDSIQPVPYIDLFIDIMKTEVKPALKEAEAECRTFLFACVMYGKDFSYTQGGMSLRESSNVLLSKVLNRDETLVMGPSQARRQARRHGHTQARA